MNNEDSKESKEIENLTNCFLSCKNLDKKFFMCNSRWECLSNAIVRDKGELVKVDLSNQLNLIFICNNKIDKVKVQRLIVDQSIFSDVASLDNLLNNIVNHTDVSCRAIIQLTKISCISDEEERLTNLVIDEDKYANRYLTDAVKVEQLSDRINEMILSIFKDEFKDSAEIKFNNNSYCF